MVATSTFTPTGSFTSTPTDTQTPTNTPTPVNTLATPACPSSTFVGYATHPLSMPVTGGNVSYEQVTPTAGNVINSIHAYFIDSGVPAALGLYSDISNHPDTLLGSTNNFVSVAGWNTAQLTAPVSVSAGVTFWFALYVSGTLADVYSFGGNTTGGPGQLIQVGAPSLPATASAGMTQAGNYLTLYADICP